MFDKIPDNKEKVIQYISNYDSNGASASNIDTQSEFNLLGQYLNGSVSIDGCVSVSELKIEDKKELEDLFSALMDKFKFASEKDIHITIENVRVYSDMLDNLTYQLQKLQEDIESFRLDPQLYPENWGETTLPKIKEQSDFIENQQIKPLISAIKKFVKQNDPYGNLTEEMNKTKEYYKYSEVLYNLIYDIEIKNKEEKTLSAINNPYDKNNLKSAADNYIEMNNSKILSPSDFEGTDLGNGKIDKIPTQKTNNCWAHSEINALNMTEKGRILLDSNIYRDEKTGIFAIHLQEAEDNGFHSGIYIITPEEIAAASETQSGGEGDITAYMAAIDKYFEEVRNNPELEEKMIEKKQPVNKIEDGNYGFRFFELITGGKMVRIYENNLENYKGILVKSYNNYDELYNIVEKNQGVVTLGYDDHSLSVVGVKDGNILVQESNSTEEYFEETPLKYNNATVIDDEGIPICMFKQSEPINGAITYEVTEENFEYIPSINILKWE